MASESTLQDTKDYFESHSYFGLEPSAVVLFEQHQLPCLTFEGKLILKTPGIHLSQSFKCNILFLRILHQSNLLV